MTTVLYYFFHPFNFFMTVAIILFGEHYFGFNVQALVGEGVHIEKVIVAVCWVIYYALFWRITNHRAIRHKKNMQDARRRRQKQFNKE